MFPLRDHNPSQTRPLVTYALIAVNVAVFAFQLSLSPYEERRFALHYGFVPAAISRGDLSAWLSAVTSMFMHGSILHCAGNMWFLHIFGDNVEDTLGPRRYLAFYVVCGLAAAAAQFFIEPGSRVPMVGASGAIAGVLGGYIRLFPHARVVAVIPIFVFWTVREVPAALFLIVWFGFQLLSGLGSLGSVGIGGVAFFAHIGGFVAGVLLVNVFGKRPRSGALSTRRGPYRERPRAWDA